MPGQQPAVPPPLVEAAVRAAREKGCDVADVSVAEIARSAGISRSTLLRRLGGTRAALDEAVRRTGIEPGGRAPVRARALEAAAWLLDESDLASTTMEAIATRAECSVEALYAAFGTRDELLRRTFERYGPLHAIQEWTAQPHDGLRESVEGFYRTVAEALTRRPQVVPSIAGQVLARASDPGARAVLEFGAPLIMGSIGAWLADEMARGRIRELPLPLLLQQLGGPILFHVTTRPLLARVLPSMELPDLEDSIELLADNFLRAVAR